MPLHADYWKALQQFKPTASEGRKILKIDISQTACDRHTPEASKRL